MANGLRESSLLSGDDAAWLLVFNAQMTAAYVDPSLATASCYDSELNPGARSLFKAEADRLLTMTSEYLRLLDRYGVPWVELRTSTPGRLVYEDAVQIVAVPHRYPDHWPFW